MTPALAPLWSIEETLQALLESVATCPDDLQPELQAEIDKYLGQKAAKVDQAAHVLAALEYEENAAGDEMARLAERKKAAKAARERLESYLCRVIKDRGVKSLNGNTNTLSVRPSDAVKITDESLIPATYKKATITIPAEFWLSLKNAEVFIQHGAVVSFAMEKDAIKKALKAGEEVSGADLEYRSNLQRT